MLHVAIAARLVVLGMVRFVPNFDNFAEIMGLLLIFFKIYMAER